MRAFARRGYEACRVGDIATEAGVAYGLVYHYFHSKEEILETIFRDTWNLMLEAIAGVEELEEPADVQLRKVIAIVLRTWKLDAEEREERALRACDIVVGPGQLPHPRAASARPIDQSVAV